mmetsp:Transcript_78777/g.210346  ORF Transcript_78777/g.210346 Transcript_78777/m.210346 type:complete len:410 (-) Transcript_78777:3532-4761(-)
MLGRLGELALDPLLTGRSEARGLDNKEPVVDASSFSCFLELQGRFGDMTAANDGKRKLGGGTGASGHAAAGFFGFPASSFQVPENCAITLRSRGNFPAARCRRAITAAAANARRATTAATAPPAPPPVSSATSTPPGAASSPESSDRTTSAVFRVTIDPSPSLRIKSSFKSLSLSLTAKTSAPWLMELRSKIPTTMLTSAGSPAWTVTLMSRSWPRPDKADSTVSTTTSRSLLSSAWVPATSSRNTTEDRIVRGRSVSGLTVTDASGGTVPTNGGPVVLAGVVAGSGFAPVVISPAGEASVVVATTGGAIVVGTSMRGAPTPVTLASRVSNNPSAICAETAACTAAANVPGVCSTDACLSRYSMAASSSPLAATEKSKETPTSARRRTAESRGISRTWETVTDATPTLR